jgi:hypothetical protein
MEMLMSFHLTTQSLKNIIVMKSKKAIIVASIIMLIGVAGWISANQYFSKSALEIETVDGVSTIKGCVFKTAFEGEGVNSGEVYLPPAKVERSIDGGLDWLAEAQANNGGYGAGSHSSQNIRDPHAVKSDPATTAMVTMALLRSGSTLLSGPHSKNINKSLNYLLETVESSDSNHPNITTITGTQIQAKLGQNIDLVLTSQCLTNMLDYLGHDPALYKRVKKGVEKCVAKIENNLSAEGSTKGAGWAGVLQSSFAVNALESAQANGVTVEEDKLENARNYQKGNYNVKNNEVSTKDAAGVVLYSVSGTARASAKEARAAKNKIAQAKKEGKLKQTDEVSEENLIKAGMTQSDAMKLGTAYEINKSAQRMASSEKVMSGYGNNGGEEFMSFLQTGEGLIVSGDDDWKDWYDNMSDRLVSIQNNDGSWNGHHCITSPVFCTATCILILAVNNDVEQLRKSTYNY